MWVDIDSHKSLASLKKGDKIRYAMHNDDDFSKFIISEVEDLGNNAYRLYLKKSIISIDVEYLLINKPTGYSIPKDGSYRLFLHKKI